MFSALITRRGIEEFKLVGESIYGSTSEAFEEFSLRVDALIPYIGLDDDNENTNWVAIKVHALVLFSMDRIKTTIKELGGTNVTDSPADRMGAIECFDVCVGGIGCFELEYTASLRRLILDCLRNVHIFMEEQPLAERNVLYMRLKHMLLTFADKVEGNMPEKPKCHKESFWGRYHINLFLNHKYLFGREPKSTDEIIQKLRKSGKLKGIKLKFCRIKPMEIKECYVKERCVIFPYENSVTSNITTTTTTTTTIMPNMALFKEKKG